MKYWKKKLTRTRTRTHKRELKTAALEHIHIQVPSNDDRHRARGIHKRRSARRVEVEGKQRAERG